MSDAGRTIWSSWWSRWWPTGLMASGCVFAMTYLSAWSEGPDGAHVLFWVAVALMVLTVAALVAAGPTRTSGFVASLALGALLFLPKLLHSPTFFNYFDEMSHVRAVEELEAGGGLFVENPLNKAVEFYPGLAAAAGVLNSVTGLSTFVAGNLLILMLHALFLGALFLLYERMAGSRQIALLAVAVYAANPAYVFFESYFAYESFALPLAASAFVAVVLSDRLAPRVRAAVVAIAIAIGLVVVVSHHVTSFVLALILLLSALSALWSRGRGDPAARVLLVAGTTVATAVAAWLLLVAPYTSEYIAPTFSDSFEAVGTAAEGEFERRATPRSELPVYERYGAYVFPFLLAGAFLVASVGLLYRRAFRREYMTPALVVVGSAYFISLPIAWLTSNSAVTRTWEFAFLGVAPLVAIALARPLLRAPLVLRGLTVVLLFVLFLGGISSRTTLAQGLPGSYEPSADPRSMTGDLLEASRWFRDRFGTGNVVMGDHAAFAVFGAYGDQQVVSGQGTGARPWLVFFPRQITPSVMTELNRDDVQFLVVDRRTTADLPRTGWYYSSNEPGAGTRSGPIPTESLDKFERSPAFETVYDNGNIVIYRYVAEAADASEARAEPRARLKVPTDQSPLSAGSLRVLASCLLECRATLAGSFSIEGSRVRHRLTRASLVLAPDQRRPLDLRFAPGALQAARRAVARGREVRGRVNLRARDRSTLLTRSIRFVLRPREASSGASTEALAG